MNVDSGIFHHRLQLSLQFLRVGEVQLVLGDEKLVGDAAEGVFHQYFVFVGAEDDADGVGVAFHVLLSAEVVEVHVHLADVLVLHFAGFQVEQHEAAQYAVVEHQIHAVVAVVERDAKLPPHEREALAEFEQKFL